MSQPDQQHTSDESGLHGRTVCLITPEACAALGDTKFEITKEVRSWSAMVEKAIRANAGSCLGMEVILATEKHPIPNADLYILDCNLIGEETQQGRDSISQSWESRVAPLVLLCSTSGSPCLETQIIDGRGIHLHQPIGPRRLASVFQSALEAKRNADSLQTVMNEQAHGLGLSGPPHPQESLESLSAAALPTLSLGQLALSPPPNPLPAQPNEAGGNSELGSKLQTQPRNKRHLLLVDDNPINVKLLVHLVQKLNLTFETASDGMEAVKLYKNSLDGQSPRFDYVFMDISMPVMNGFEATREIRQMETQAAARRCKVIALTGLSSDVNRNEASASGCDLFLTKPVKMATVRGLLDSEGQEE